MPEGFNEAFYCVSCVNDIFDDDDSPSFDVFVKPYDFFDNACRSCPFVAFQPDKRDLGIHVDGTEQVRGERERSVKHAKEYGQFAFAVLFYGFCQFFYAAVYRLTFDIRFKREAVVGHLFHFRMNIGAKIANDFES